MYARWISSFRFRANVTMTNQLSTAPGTVRVGQADMSAHFPLRGTVSTIEPRFGLATLRNWLFEATSVVLTDAPGNLREDESFIAQLLASVWAHGFVDAARHGLPALRRDVATRGATIRGRLDVAASLRLIADGGGQVVSIRSERSLDHAASDAIVAAYEVLRRWLGVPDDQWMPARAKELVPHLMSITGARPRVPTKAESNRIRYTPITARFAPIAEFSPADRESQRTYRRRRRQWPDQGCTA